MLSIEELAYISNVIDGKFTLQIGSFLYLPLGGYLVALILYKESGLLGMFIMSILMTLYYEIEMPLLVTFSFINVVGPLITLIIFKVLNVSNFENLCDLRISILVFLALFAAMLNSSMKFIALFIGDSLFAGTINPLEFLQSYLVGDFLGALTFMLMSIWVIRGFRLDRLSKNH